MVCPAHMPSRNIHRKRQKQTTTRPNIPLQPSSMRKGLNLPSSTGGRSFRLKSPTARCHARFIVVIKAFFSIAADGSECLFVSLSPGKTSRKTQKTFAADAACYMLSGAVNPTRCRPLRKTRFNPPQSARRAQVNSLSLVNTLCLL